MSADHRVCVLSDLHANGRATKAALARAYRDGFDQLVILGDLLTYGIDDAEVLDLVDDAVASHGAVVIVGNHDALYLEGADGGSAYEARLADWLRECVHATRAKLDADAFRRRYEWRTSHRIGPVYLAHANAHPYPNWAYLNYLAALEEARARVRAMGAWVGVFGHNHRAGVYAGAPDVRQIAALGDVRALDASLSGVIVNPGSVGQPRQQGAPSSFARLDVRGSLLDVALVPVDYDVAAHVGALRAAGFSAATTDKLCSYFVTG